MLPIVTYSIYERYYVLLIHYREHTCSVLDSTLEAEKQAQSNPSHTRSAWWISVVPCEHKDVVIP